MNYNKNIFFRTDANRNIGSGHLVRCEIIADFIKSSYDCNIHFIIKNIADKFQSRLECKGYQLHFIQSNTENELPEIIKIIDYFSNRILIIDSDDKEFYTKSFQLGIKKMVEKLVIITFYSKYHFYSDIIHNQNVIAKDLSYSCEPYTKKLLGLKYVILNKRFKQLIKKSKRKESNKVPKTGLITFGGSDEPNRTKTAYLSLLNLRAPLSKIIIVAGAMYNHIDELKELIKSAQIKTLLYQNTERMPELMADSDLAITSGGLTSWELGSLGVLNIIIPFSDREITTAKYLDKKKLAYIVEFKEYSVDDIGKKLDSILNENYDNRSKRLMNKIDGFGTNRFVKELFKTN